jgi:hypothetical protein
VSRQRTWPTFAVLIVAALALALGSVSTAAAGALTSRTVKKIATKVVKHEAKNLSVASAVTAKNARTVGGFPASALQEQRTVYTITVSPAVNSISRTIPLPSPGSYEISYSAYLEVSTGGPSECFVERTSGSGIVLQDYADDASSGAANFTAHSAVDVVTTGPGEVVKLHCNAGAATFTTPGFEPIQVVVTPLAGVTTVALTGSS